MAKEGVTRRDFIKGLGVGTGFTFMGMMGGSYAWRKQFLPEMPKGTTDIGQCKSLKVTCVTETSWFDSDLLLRDIVEMGGLLSQQWNYPWPPLGDWHKENAGGYAAILDIELLDGDHKFILLDTGWDPDWTDKRFKEEGVDKMLKNDEFELLFISHEHFDHFWGIPVTMKYNPNIRLWTGGDYYPEGVDWIAKSGFKGEWRQTKSKTRELFRVTDRRGVPIPGVAAYYFPMGIICRVYGEESLFFDIKDVGIVQITGCCHQGILHFADTAYMELLHGDRPFGVYGGLHISPFEDWDPAYDDLVINLGGWNFQKLGCNHCTGYVTAKKFFDYGYPMVPGTCSAGSDTLSAAGKCKYYLGNSDSFTFP